MYTTVYYTNKDVFNSIQFSITCSIPKITCNLFQLQESSFFFRNTETQFNSVSPVVYQKLHVTCSSFKKAVFFFRNTETTLKSVVNIVFKMLVPDLVDVGIICYLFMEKIKYEVDYRNLNSCVFAQNTKKIHSEEYFVELNISKNVYLYSREPHLSYLYWSGSIPSLPQQGFLLI
jgi:hypothetical protein